MAERKNCQGLNSKCFLLTYLAVVGFLLLLWSNSNLFIQQEYREIPDALSPYIVSPPKQVDIDISDESKKLALTSNFYGGHWVWVYFSHAQCLDSCAQPYKKLSAIRAGYANNDIKMVIVDLDSEATAKGQLANSLKDGSDEFDVLELHSTELIETLAQQFELLFLKTDYTDGSYLIEQQHDIFLIDPKGRVYARFGEQLSAAEIKDKFMGIRQFYAKTE